MNEQPHELFKEQPRSAKAWIAASIAVCVAAFIFTCAQYYGWLGFDGTKQLREESIAARKVIRD